MKKNLIRSIDLPLEEQYKENWGWEDSYQRYELDQEFQDKEYFQDMDPDDLIHLVRKMDNFLRERGISDFFFEKLCFGKSSVL
jgi:hypothetical protein